MDTGGDNDFGCPYCAVPHRQRKAAEDCYARAVREVDSARRLDDGVYQEAAKDRVREVDTYIHRRWALYP